MRHIHPVPVNQVLPQLRDALRRGTGAVLQAPPGAAKTTRVPLALLDEPVGETVGYRVRHESMVGPTTRIVVVTEGILTRMLQRDPALE